MNQLLHAMFWTFCESWLTVAHQRQQTHRLTFILEEANLFLRSPLSTPRALLNSLLNTGLPSVILNLNLRLASSMIVREVKWKAISSLLDV